MPCVNVQTPGQLPRTARAAQVVAPANTTAAGGCCDEALACVMTPPRSAPGGAPGQRAMAAAATATATIDPVTPNAQKKRHRTEETQLESEAKTSKRPRETRQTAAVQRSYVSHGDETFLVLPDLGGGASAQLRVGDQLQIGAEHWGQNKELVRTTLFTQVARNRVARTSTERMQKMRARQTDAQCDSARSDNRERMAKRRREMSSSAKQDWATYKRERRQHKRLQAKATQLEQIARCKRLEATTVGAQLTGAVAAHQGAQQARRDEHFVETPATLQRFLQRARGRQGGSDCRHQLTDYQRAELNEATQLQEAGTPDDSTRRLHACLGRFDEALSAVQLETCPECKERWFDMEMQTHAGRTMCAQCVRECKKNAKFLDGRQVSSRSAANDMDPGPVPPELQDLTPIEQRLISRICTYIQVAPAAWRVYLVPGTLCSHTVLQVRCRSIQ